MNPLFIKVLAISSLAFLVYILTFILTYASLLWTIEFDNQRWQFEVLYGLCALSMAFVVLAWIKVWAVKELNK